MQTENVCRTGNHFGLLYCKSRTVNFPPTIHTPPKTYGHFCFKILAIIRKLLEIFRINMNQVLYFAFLLLSILFKIKLLIFQITPKKREVKKPPSILESLLTTTELEELIFRKDYLMRMIL